MDVELELLASGYGLVEGPRTDVENNLYFSDIPGGGIFRRSPDGEIETVVADRKLVGGLALHADGGLVASGPNVVHIDADGNQRVLLELDEVMSFNDLQPDAAGNVIVGCIRRDFNNPDDPKINGECYRVGVDGEVVELYDEVEVSNGIGFSPDATRMYHSDSTTKGLWVHDVAADGSISNRRHIGKAAFERGVPDGMCVDVDGNLWVAHFGGRRVVKLAPEGDELDAIAVPAKAVTSCAFGGPDWSDMYIVTADNLDDESLGGGIYRCRPGVAGVPTPLARV